MCEIYTPRKCDNSNDLTSAAFIAGLATLAAFALLPILTQVPNPFAPPTSPPIDVISEPIPDFIVPEPPTIAKKPEELVEPEIELPPPLVTIQMVALMINAGDNGVKVNSGWSNAFTDEDTSLEIFLPSQLDQQPRVLVAAKPLYPYSMKDESGEVVVEFIIDAKGEVKRPRVIKASNRGFEQAALEAVLKSKWQPGQKNGAPVQTLVRLPVNFKR